MFSKSIKWTCMCFVNIHGCSKFTIQPANWAPCLMENPMGSLGWSHEAPWNSQLSPDHHRTNETQVVIRVSSLPLDLERSVYVLHRSMIHIWGILFRDVTQRSDITISGAIQAHMDPDFLMHTKKIYPLVNYNLTLLWKIMTLSPSLLAVCQSVTCSSIAVFFGGDLGRFRRYQLLSSRENQQNPTRTSPSAFPPPKKKTSEVSWETHRRAEVFRIFRGFWCDQLTLNLLKTIQLLHESGQLVLMRHQNLHKVASRNAMRRHEIHDLWRVVFRGSHFKNQVPKNDLYNGMIGYPLVN